MKKQSLDAVARGQLKLATTASSRRSAKTLVGGHERFLRQTVVALLAGTTMAEHSNPGEATLLVIVGRVRLSAGDDNWEGRPGDLIVIPEAPHSVEALHDSAILLTVGKTS